MCRFVLVVLVCLSFYARCSGEPEIKIFVEKLDDGSIICPSEDIVSPKLTLNKNFEIFVYSDVMIQDGECYSTEAQTIYIHHFQKMSEYYTPTERLVLTNSWTKEITCEFYITSCVKSISCTKQLGFKFYSGTKCKFFIDFRIPDMGYMEVNGIKVPTTPASETDSFDSSGVYSFFEDEFAMVTCRNAGPWSKNSAPQNNFLQLRLVNGNRTIETKKLLKNTEPVKMYAKLSASSNGGRVDCIIENYRNTRSFVSRIYFQLKNTLPALGFKVNGLTLPLVQWPECNLEPCYKYEYYDNENVLIQSLKDETRFGDLNCTSKTEHGVSLPRGFYFTKHRQSSIHVATVIREIVHQIVFLDCVVDEYYKTEDKTIELILVPNTVAEYRPIVKGLSAANISVMHTSTVLNTIYYEYDNPLSLSCHSETANPQWKYNESEVEETNYVMSDISYAEVIKTNSITRALFTLKDELNMSVISCISSQSMTINDVPVDKTTQIIIQRQKKNGVASVDSDGEAATSIPSDTSTAGNLETHSSKPIDKWVLMGAGLGMLVLLVIVTCIIIRLVRRKRQKPCQDPTDINYENLPEHKGGIMSSPSQWNEAQYASPTDTLANSEYAQPYTAGNAEDMYSKPIPKTLRGFEESPYASVGDSPTYAQVEPKHKRAAQGVQVLPSAGNLIYAKLMAKTKKPEVSFNESPYAEVTKKGSPYASVSESPYAEAQESPYATVSHSGSPYAEALKGESPYADPLKDESPYASVTPGECPYAEPDCIKNYGNVFDGERYVNALNSKDDYAEPAYCEVGKLKK